ncbi:hypothetical protein KO516_13900, partial [Citreicella sp. C3M06]|uniref:hypothetical protein n=1 Tax=Citreicella sp. C3M06 TaxID=2841564 RepID=UPI001C0849B9
VTRSSCAQTLIRDVQPSFVTLPNLRANVRWHRVNDTRRALEQAKAAVVACVYRVVFSIRRLPAPSDGERADF